MWGTYADPAPAPKPGLLSPRLQPQPRRLEHRLPAGAARVKALNHVQGTRPGGARPAGRGLGLRLRERARGCGAGSSRGASTRQAQPRWRRSCQEPRLTSPRPPARQATPAQGPARLHSRPSRVPPAFAPLGQHVPSLCRSTPILVPASPRPWVSAGRASAVRSEGCRERPLAVTAPVWVSGPRAPPGAMGWASGAEV